MALEIQTHMFSSINALRDWMAEHRLSLDPSRLPCLIQIDNANATQYRLFVLDEAPPGGTHAFERRGLVGVGVAAGTNVDSPVGADEQWYALGETSDTEVEGEVIGTGDGIETEFTGIFLAGGMVVPGTLVVSAVDTEDLTEPETPDGTLEGSEYPSTGTIDHVSRAVSLSYDAGAVPGVGDITADYSYNPYPASTAVPPGAHLVRLEIERLAGEEAAVDFTWTIAEDRGGHTAIATGSTGDLAPNERYSTNLDISSIIQDPLLAQQGKRWIGLVASAGEDNVVLVKLLFRAE